MNIFLALLRKVLTSEKFLWHHKFKNHMVITIDLNLKSIIELFAKTVLAGNSNSLVSWIIPAVSWSATLVPDEFQSFSTEQTKIGHNSRNWSASKFMNSSKNYLINIFLAKKHFQIYSAHFWYWNLTLKIKSWQFSRALYKIWVKDTSPRGISNPRSRLEMKRYKTRHFEKPHFQCSEL